MSQPSCEEALLAEVPGSAAAPSPRPSWPLSATGQAALLLRRH